MILKFPRINCFPLEKYILISRRICVANLLRMKPLNRILVRAIAQKMQSKTNFFIVKLVFAETVTNFPIRFSIVKYLLVEKMALKDLRFSCFHCMNVMNMSKSAVGTHFFDMVFFFRTVNFLLLSCQQDGNIKSIKI